MTHNFKSQLLTVFLLFSSAMGLAFYFAIDYGIHQTEDYILKSYLKSAVDHRLTQTSPQVSEYYAITSQQLTRSELPLQLGEQPSIIYQTQDESGFQYIRSLPDSSDYLIATLSETTISDFEEKEIYITTMMIFIVIVIVLLSWLVALWLTHIIAHPLLQLTKVINDLPIKSDINSSLPLYGLHREDEIGQLSRAFRTLLGRVQSALQQERAFSHHVSHELRTPLAIINNATALLKKQPAYNETKIANNIERIDRSLDRLNSRITLFLYLGQTQQTKQTISPKALWENTVTYIQQQIVEPIPFRLQTIDDTTLQATPSLILALFENSLLNAVQYGTYIDVELNDKHYQITNPIIDSARLPENHFGYGIAIIQRICDASHWQLHIEKTASHFQLTARFT